MLCGMLRCGGHSRAWQPGLGPSLRLLQLLAGMQPSQDLGLKGVEQHREIQHLQQAAVVVMQEAPDPPLRLAASCQGG